MANSKLSIEEVSGFLGVGSLEILGIFLILDGTLGFLAFVEIYAQTSAWAILVTIPLLVVAYVLGVISSFCVDEIIQWLYPSRLTPELLRAVADSKVDALLQKYLEAERHTQLLHGCVVAFILLALGSWAEVRMMGSFGLVGYAGLIGGLTIAALCPLLARRLQMRVARFVQAFA